MAEPKKETARIALPRKTEITPDHQHLSTGLDGLRILEPTASALAVSVKKTQPQIAGLEIGQTSPVMVAPSRAFGAVDSIPRWFCWGLLGISVLIFLIQIWNYALS